MSGGSAPAAENDDLEIRQLELDSAEKERVRNEQAATKKSAELAQRRTGAASSAREDVQGYFSGKGINSGDYEGAINRAIASALNRISPTDENPGAAFEGIGASVYDQEKGNRQGKLSRQLSELLPSNFEQSRISDEADDPTLLAIEAEQRRKADAIIRNMMDRGVLTGTGYGAAKGDLDQQSYSAKARLNEIGSGALAGGRQTLRDIANKGRQAVSTLDLGTQFDPYSYGSDVDKAFNNFMQNLGTNIRGKAPGDLFTTSGLAAIGGSAQGAGNTAFNPKAVQGIIDTSKDDEDEDDDLF